MNKKHAPGFTVIEIIVVVLFLSVATALLLIQRENLAATHRDDQRKTAINAIYYTLEEVYYPKNGHYPAQITSETLPAVDPDLLVDPNGITINGPGADYHYEGSNCNNDTCQSYTLRAELEKEADFVKTDRPQE